MPIRINGLNTGSVTLSASATGGDVTLNLPNANGTVATTSYADTAPGLQYITGQTFTAVSAVNINNCFTSTYDNYRIMMRITNSVSVNMQCRVRASGSDLTTSTYRYGRYLLGTTTAFNAGSDNQTDSQFPLAGSADSAGHAIDVLSPMLAQQTSVLQISQGSIGQILFGQVANTTAYDGFTVFPASGTITGTIRVYGYRNS
jgi:hypothetical protein